jgi:hypothetical protein
MKRLCAMVMVMFAMMGESKANVAADGNFWLRACTHKALKDVTCTAFIFGLRGAFEMSSDYYKVPKSQHLYCAPAEVTLGSVDN